eukprot:768037-Hanusia_phi.AAC.1
MKTVDKLQEYFSADQMYRLKSDLVGVSDLIPHQLIQLDNAGGRIITNRADEKMEKEEKRSGRDKLEFEMI